MLNIGCHLSAAKGYEKMGLHALQIGANTFQFFTRNPRGGKAKAIDEQDIAALLSLAEAHHFATLLAHAPYTLNACAADERVMTFAREVMADDLARLAYLPGVFYNFHPGSHVGQGVEMGVSLIAQLLNETLRPEQRTTVLLETMSGKGSEIGGTFEELRAILDQVNHPELMGVCLDTCHVFDGGYDIVHDLEGVLTHFDQVVGLEKLKAIHLNDSMNGLGSHKDRHACIGQGNIGLEALVAVINHPQLRDLPFFLETPNELPGYAEEIAMLRAVYQSC